MTIASIPARPHDFPLDTAKSALLIVDMQNDFCHPDGFCCHDLGVDAETVARVRSIIPRIRRVLEWARRADITVIYTKEAHRADLSDLPPSKKLRYENAGYPVGSPSRLGRYLVQGERGSQVVEELRPLDTEMQIDKPAQSAFIATDLETTLRHRGVTHLIVTGVTTQCCVLATYRQASDLGFFVLLLEDCCAAFDIRDHQAAVDVLCSEGGAVGWVSTSEKLPAR